MSSDHPVLRDCYKNWWRSEEDADAMMGAKIVLEGKECLGLGLGPAARAGLGGFERVRAGGRVRITTFLKFSMCSLRKLLLEIGILG